MLTEIKYRNFDELLNSVRIDLPSFDLEGFINPQELIKVAIRINYELGLKINPVREKTIHVHQGKGKLPADFHVLNFALKCSSGKLQYATDRIHRVDGTLEELRRLARLMNARPYHCVADMHPGDNTVMHNLGVTDLVIRILDEQGNPVDFDYRIVDPNQVIIKLNCYVNATINIIGAANATRCELHIDECGTGEVHESRSLAMRTYSDLTPVEILPVSYGGPHGHGHKVNSKHKGRLKNGFFEALSFEEGTVYLNYQSLMENGDGELITLDHPLANEYYEYALKQRILENMTMNGEQVDKLLQIVEARYKPARNNAISFASTPDFHELKRMWEKNRKAMYHKYYDPIK